MQIIRTEVDEAIGHAGRPVLRVVFYGESGECVSVDMVKAGAVVGTDESAIERARAILVQTSTFDVAANDYDALSNGNFDEVAVIAVDDQSGAGVYIFEYRDGDGGRMLLPSDMPSSKAARDEAVRCAIELLVDLQPGTDALSGWLVRVRDEHGRLLWGIDVPEAQAARQVDDAAV